MDKLKILFVIPRFLLYIEGKFILPKKHDDENQEIYDLTHHGGLVVLLNLLLLFLIQHGLIVNLIVIQYAGVGVNHNI